MTFSYSTMINFAAPAHSTLHEGRLEEQVDTLRGLEKENSRLQELVCDLLRKNEALRMQLDRCWEEGIAEA
jgi:predicted nuclease with TOPRIM domain